MRKKLKEEAEKLRILEKEEEEKERSRKLDEKDQR